MPISTKSLPQASELVSDKNTLTSTGGGKRSKRVNKSSITETATQGSKRKAVTQGGTKTKKPTPPAAKSTTTVDKPTPTNSRVPLRDVTRKPNEGAPELASTPDGNVQLASNPKVDFETERARIMREAEEKINALKKAESVGGPVNAVNTPKTVDSTSERVNASNTNPISAIPEKRWPPVRKFNRDRIPSQYLNIVKPAVEQPKEPQLTAQSLEGRVEKSLRDIEPIQRPRGEAGDGKRGFCLQEAVELDEVGTSADLFADFLARVRANATLARIDLTKTFRQQDPDVISLVCRKTALDLPYFGKEQFPGYWPTREALKQYIKNQRKYMERQRKARGLGNRARKNNPFRDNTIYYSDGVDDDEDDEDDNGAGPSGTGHDD
ncbi:hypothetical protein FB446DRAFT_776293 [Lentinula raphanica]|nr:hypothetical protein FB446DRAFT_776293 [Lentinula raphanica]